MSMRNLVIILLSSFLLLATAPTVPAMHHHNEAEHRQIRDVQTALKEKGFDPGPIDGLMGPKTQKALQDFQSQNDLAVTGKIDQETQLALGVAGKTGSISQASRQKPSATVFEVEDIRQVQIALKDRGYDPGEINGMLSTDTQEAIRKFQEANNLPVTGQLDERTRLALGVTTTETGKQAQRGAHMGRMDQNSVVITLSGENMRRIHTTLRAEGINVGTTGPHAMQMMEAIRQFQTKHNLPATGHLDERTLAALNLRIDVQAQPGGTTSKDK